MEEIAPTTNSCTKPAELVKLEKIKTRTRPQAEQQLNCPRCNSTNTKFCYYNNYSLTQPRYLCKTCRRYWTEGGSLRNVPVGGGSRNHHHKNNNKTRVITTTTTTSSSISSSSLQNLKIMQGGGGGGGLHDLNLAFPAAAMETSYHGIMSSSYVDQVGSDATPTNSLSTMELLRHDMASSRSNLISPYVPSLMMPNNSNNDALYSSSEFPMQEIKPNIGSSIDDELGESQPYQYGVQEENINGGRSGRLFFPFVGDMKQQVSEVEQNKEQGNSAGSYWTGMIGEGSSW